MNDLSVCCSFMLAYPLPQQVHAFVAPKIIGGKNAPSPVGELGMVEMSQALELIDVNYEQVKNNSDMLLYHFCIWFIEI